MLIATLIITVALTAATQVPAGDVSALERQALMQLFEATGGSQWTKRDGWGSSRPACDWYGVFCDFLDGNPGRPVVAGLSLGSNGLRGVLPAGLAALEHLTSIDVSRNQLTGAIPERLLNRWDSHHLWLRADGNWFASLVRRAVVQYSATGTLCAVHDDVNFRLSLDEAKGAAVFESVRCADVASRKTYCLVRQGTPWSLDRLSRGLRQLRFSTFGPEYDYPAGNSVTHATYVTTTAEWGDGSKRTVKTYGRQGPLEVWMAQQLFLGLIQETYWNTETRKPRCSFETTR